ncbi:hypothetical protein GCM10022226_28310 [Sphaerisporangium flaviroseum]|uniref:MCE family protein n=1 Tax=Sphaerisporangium flaviroseum TaxID=509199 RepID=A0ABP7I467_9ACTN
MKPVTRTAVLLASVLALCVSVSGCSLRTAGAPTGSLTINATFDDAQSLVAGHSVQISDVHIGTVTGVTLAGYRAKVTMSIQDGRRIPKGTRATVAKTSILGENYVELEIPEGRDLTTGPFMRNGETITKTSVQPDIEQVTAKAGPLIDALSGQDINAILDAAATAFGGKGEDLNRLISRTTEVAATYAEARADIAIAIDGLARLGSDLEKGGPELDRLPGTLEAATARLAHGRHHVKQVLIELTDLARAANKTFYPRHAARLKHLLDRLDAIAGSMLRGKEDLKRLVSTMRKFIGTPPITANGQLLIYVWLKGLLPPRSRSASPPSGNGKPPSQDRDPRDDGFRLLLEPPR